MSSAERYVFAAYTVVLGAVLLYVVIYAFKIARLRREVAELAEAVARRHGHDAEPEPEESAVR